MLLGTTIRIQLVNAHKFLELFEFSTYERLWSFVGCRAQKHKTPGRLPGQGFCRSQMASYLTWGASKLRKSSRGTNAFCSICFRWFAVRTLWAPKKARKVDPGRA